MSVGDLVGLMFLAFLLFTKPGRGIFLVLILVAGCYALVSS